MDSLKRLIDRLTCPRGISNEDAFDTVKQYWEDVTSGFWQDTDEELADELGVTPTALAELLEVHRHTFNYANIGGNSSVRGYDHGEDWLVVMFSDGSRYLYTLKSTDQQTLDYMRRLAMAGKGLNSYITRIVGPNYAGRNYKGTITIKPGMEQYNPEGYRRLLLIQAFRNTMEHNTVSNEGVWDTLKRLFSTAPKDKEKPTPAAPPEYVWETASRIEKSPPKKLTQTSSASPIFQKNGVFNPNWIKQLESDLKQYQRVTKELTSYDQKVKTWVKAWEPKLDDYLGDADRAEEFAETLRGWNAAQPKPWSEVWRNNYDFIGYGKDGWLDSESGFSYSAMNNAKTVTIPAQSDDQTRQIIKLISELGDFLIYTFEVSDKLTVVGYDFTDPPFRGYYDIDIVVAQLNQAKYTSETAVSPFSHFEVIEHRIEDILTALVSYVKSTESNSVGNEVYTHHTLKRYKEQITAAGTDGLDPIARGIMAVGLESMGYGAKVSLEYIDDQPVNETQALEGIIDNALSGSMEGFWDSIKDFFAGRPTKVHLAGSDPGLRSKLNSTINDRTWLSRQKYTLGGVNYKALPDFNPSTAAQMVNNYRSAVSMAVQHNKREMSKINDRLRAVNNCFALYSQRDIFDTSFIKIVMDDINPYVVRLNINIKEPDLTPQAMVTQTGSALTKVEIKQFAELIGQVFDSQSSFAGSISVNSSLNYQANLNFRYANKPGGAAVLAALRQLQQQYQHLVVMINREIKQRISTHTAWIVAENLADSMVNYIAKSISNVSSNESFVGKPQASNEGIWGAVRYLFGGNYEDLPKINAAYDEAVDAVKATYANPEWVKKRRLNTGKPIKLASHYFSEIANDPAKALERVKKENRKAVDDVIQYVKEEVEYLSKFTKALSSGDEVKIKALLDMFEVRKVRSLDVAEELGFDHGDEVKGMSAEQIHKAAEVFIDGINYRRSTDAFYTQGMYKLMYTEAGNIRYGDGGAVTEKLNGPAKELAIKIGQSADNVERSFYNSFGPAWENVDRVVKTTLAIMEASAK